MGLVIECSNRQGLDRSEHMHREVILALDNKDGLCILL